MVKKNCYNCAFLECDIIHKDTKDEIIFYHCPCAYLQWTKEPVRGELVSPHPIPTVGCPNWQKDRDV